MLFKIIINFKCSIFNIHNDTKEERMKKHRNVKYYHKHDQQAWFENRKEETRERKWTKWKENKQNHPG